ncbi:hypothetical protein AAFF_G00154030 [Aldrovandia affinis]|uniref:Uncharacterized protein n=1 Tax=Aldrovandia affinis TaxID=143900 RepID=A0AAD7WWM7_9TELE|nr:hypothetical protein AAFF_G00154030 [Aldrovandia affinis]
MPGATVIAQELAKADQPLLRLSALVRAAHISRAWLAEERHVAGPAPREPEPMLAGASRERIHRRSVTAPRILTTVHTSPDFSQPRHD